MWNTNARNCQDAQVVLQVLLTHVPPEELLQYQGARTHLEGLIPYTGEWHVEGGAPGLGAWGAGRGGGEKAPPPRCLFKKKKKRNQ